MGSLYRSQHELVFVFKHGRNGHRNNVQLGQFGFSCGIFDVHEKSSWRIRQAWSARKGDRPGRRCGGCTNEFRISRILDVSR